MKVSKQRKKSNLIAGLTGGLATLLIVVICTGVYLRFMKEEKKDISLEEYVHIDNLKKVVVTKEDIIMGDKITAEMLDVVYIEGEATEYALDLTDIIGKRSGGNILKGMPIVKNNLFEDIVVSDDLRNHEITYIELPSLLKKGDYIDIRIVFPDGEDYIVVSKKQVQRVEYSEEGTLLSTMWVNLHENERLHLSSAIVEAAAYETAKIYAISYVLPDLQEEAIVNYPVNTNVYELIINNPNIVDEAIKKLTIRGENTYVKGDEEDIIKYQYEE
jgi:hypothetical protein